MEPEALLDAVRAGGLLPPGHAVVVLLSGGRDSVCLLDVAVALGCAARALHVNYGLRDEADGDEAHCRALCARLGVALTVHHATRPEDAAGNLQRQDVYKDKSDAQGEKRPAFAELRRDESEPGEHRGGERDHKPRDLLSGAAGFHACGHDHRDAARRDQIQER